MSSKRGFPFANAVITFRIAVLALLMAGAATLASAAQVAPGNGSYLALGDSIAFGYIADDGYAYVNPNNFIAYPSYAGRDLRFDTADAACPGESSGSFFSSIAPDNGCRDEFRSTFPLHVSYASTQLDFATAYLATHKQTRLVTIQLGANDIFLLVGSCFGDPTCVLNGLNAALSTLYANMDHILHTLRASGFQGVLVVVNYYSVDYTDQLQTFLTASGNQTLAAVAQANHAVVADVFTAFQAVAALAGGQTCKAGLLNANASDPSHLTCDIHPTQSGQQLIAGTVEARYQAALLGL